MGVFSWINRLLFGAESVAKSGAGKARDAGSDAYDNLRDTAKDLFEKGKGAAKETTDEFQEKLDELGDRIERKRTDPFRQDRKTGSSETGSPDNVEDLLEQELSDEAADAMETPVDSADPDRDDTLDDLADTAEEIGNKVLETGKKVGDKIREAGDKKMEKAKELADKAGRKIRETMDDMLEKARQMEEEEAAEEEANPTGIREDSTHADALKDSSLEHTDDFFSKAAAFAEGKYGEVRDEPEITIPDRDKKKKKEGTVKGFEDMDGDGDEIIDDAIIESEEE